MTGLAVRPYEVLDREALADLWVAAWQATMPDIDFAARRPWLCGLLDDQAASGTVTLCASAGSAAPIGFAMIEPARCHLEQLAVAPGAWSSGAARLLLDAAKALSPARLGLRVNQENMRAVRFYTREGFRIVASGMNPRRPARGVGHGVAAGIHSLTAPRCQAARIAWPTRSGASVRSMLVALPPMVSLSANSVARAASLLRASGEASSCQTRIRA